MPTTRFQRLAPDRRRDLLAAAAAEFAERGYEAASVNRILERIGSSKGALYYWFEDKADLYRTVLQDCLVRYVMFCGLPPAPIRTPVAFWAEVERLAERSLRFYREDRVALALVRAFYAAPGRSENAAPGQDFHAATEAWSRPLLALGHEVGAIRRDIPDDLLLAVSVGMTEGLDAWLVAHAEAITDDEVGPTACRLAGLFRRLSAPEGSVSSIPLAPSRLPFVGSALTFARDPLGNSVRWARDLGDIVCVTAPGKPVYLVSHPDLAEQVLVRNHARYIKDEYTRLLSGVLGEGLVTSEGDLWRRQRRRIQPAFNHDRLAAYALDMVRLAGRTADGWQDGEVVDLHAEMMRLTLAIVAATLFGSDVDDDARAMAAAIDVLSNLYLGFFGTGWRLPDSWPTPANYRRRAALAVIDDVVGRLIAERRLGEDRGDLCTMLLRARDDEGAMSEQQVRDELVTMLVAGHETTAVVLTFAAWLLAGNPAAAARLRAEVATLSGPPTVADLARLPYTDAVITEAMRLYPPVWAIGREATERVEVGEHVLPKGAQVWLVQWSVHRDPRWFEHAESFQPERWLGGELRKRIPKLAFLPFGAGPRQCIGSRFAQMEAVLVLATLTQRFALEAAPGETLDLLASATLRPRRGLRMRAVRRAL